MKNYARWFMTAALLMGSAPGALALGFRNPDQGARATGQGEAFVAQADDPSAIYYNPAGLTQLEGHHLSAGGYVSFRNIEYAGPFGSATLNDPAYTAHLYLASDLGSGNWRFGFGVNMPFGTDSNWGDESPFVNSVTESEMMVLNYQPTVAYKFNKHWSLGVGLNIYDGTTRLESLPFAPFLPQAQLRFHGSGLAAGTTIGVLYKLNDQHSFGATYRSPFRIEFDGSAKVSGVVPKANAQAIIDFPQSAILGYAFRPIQKLKLEVDVEWTDWDVLNDVTLESGNALDGTTIAYRYKSSFYFEVGAQYDLTDHWAVRAGYIFSENSVPEETFSATTPDADRHVFSVGAGFRGARGSVDLVYQFSLSEDRDVDQSENLTANGTWKSQAHALMLTATVKF